MTRKTRVVTESLVTAAQLHRMVPSVLIAASVLWPGLTRAADTTACTDAIMVVERSVSTPPQLLRSLALVESGRRIATRATPWPWTINVAGVGHYYESKDDAIAAVQSARSSGVQSIDVGCMQINLAMHPHAFASLDEAFDPKTNAAYGARFVTSLFQANGSWGAAITSYHSKTPRYAAEYARRVLAVWPEAAAYGLSDHVPPVTGPDGPQRVHIAGLADYLVANRTNQTRRWLADSTRGTRSLVSALSQPRHGLAWPGA